MSEYNQICNVSTYFRKGTNNKLLENPSSGSRADKCGMTETAKFNEKRECN